jgi:hypothetical protein
VTDSEEGAPDGFANGSDDASAGFADEVLHECPAWLYRVQVRRIGRQMEDARPSLLDQLSDLRRVVGTQIVQHDDISPLELRAEAFSDERDEFRTVHRAGGHLMAHDTVGADGARDAQGLPPVRRLPIQQPLPAFRAPSARGHRRVAPGFVQKDETRGGDRLYLFEERLALLDVLWSVAFARTEPFFFQVYPARSRARCMDERLSSTPQMRCHRSANSRAVASGVSFTIASSRARSETRGSRPPACGLGSTSPVSLRRRSQRETEASPTPNLFAISAYVPSPRT